MELYSYIEHIYASVALSMMGSCGKFVVGLSMIHSAHATSAIYNVCGQYHLLSGLPAHILTRIHLCCVPSKKSYLKCNACWEYPAWPHILTIPGPLSPLPCTFMGACLPGGGGVWPPEKLDHR